MSVADRRPPFYLGIDLGGTNIKSGVVDDRGQALSSVSLETEAEHGPEEGLDESGRGGPSRRRGQRARLGRHRGRRAGLAGDDGPGGGDAPRPAQPARLGEPADPADASAIAWASRRCSRTTPTPRPSANTGPARGGTRGASSCSRSAPGSAAGSSIDGRILEGRHSHGAECGHIIIQMENGRQCSCGGFGHLEAYASATALVKRAEEALERGESSTPARARWPPTP